VAASLLIARRREFRKVDPDADSILDSTCAPGAYSDFSRKL
jgi:hypothetical protein